MYLSSQGEAMSCRRTSTEQGWGGSVQKWFVHTHVLLAHCHKAAAEH